MAEKSPGAGQCNPLRSASRTTPAAIGCSERLSTLAASVAKPAPSATMVSHRAATVGQVLRARAGFLGLPHHLDDLGQICLVAGFPDLERYGGFPVDGAADIASPIRVIMPGRLLASSFTRPFRKGHPP